MRSGAEVVGRFLFSFFKLALVEAVLVSSLMAFCLLAVLKTVI